MPIIEDAVQAHYTTGGLTDRVLRGMRTLGIDPDNAKPSDLKAADEFHTGGLEATEHFFGHMTVQQDFQVLDVGSGIGGTSRYIADTFGAEVTGVDLTPEFVQAARVLSAMVGLSDKVTFLVGSATDMPVPDGSYDLAVMLHVGMNIPDKPALFADTARALRPGARFGVFDVMRGASDEALKFPLPWAETADTSFVVPPEAYVAAAEAAGMTLVAEHDRTEWATAYFDNVLEATERSGPPALGIHLMMGDTAPLKFRNYHANLKAGRVRPTEMIFERAGA